MAANMEPDTTSNALASNVTSSSAATRPAWYSVPEILSRVIEVQLLCGDIWIAAACSRVSRLWQRVATFVVQRNWHHFRSMNNFTMEKARQFSKVVTNAPDNDVPYTLGIPPFRSNEPLAHFYNHLLMKRMIGKGSFSRVYHFGGISPLCVKVASGGLTDAQEFQRNLERAEINAQIEDIEHRPALEYGYISSGQCVKLISHRKVTYMLAFEYAHLQHLASLPLPPDEPAQLFPRPYYFGYVAQTSYYVMEKLPGITLRRVISAAAPLNVLELDASDLVEIDFVPLIIRLLRYMHLLMRVDETFHGDLKPENMILVPEGYIILVFLLQKLKDLLPPPLSVPPCAIMCKV